MKPYLNKKNIKKLSSDNKDMLQAVTPQVAGGIRSLPPTNPMQDCPMTKDKTRCVECLPTGPVTCPCPPVG
ncbi:hypothetical protein [Pseudoalteromonas luteoviolacea]|uniref:Uncharacterized protein n=1 Tax=Pseudoalteromonas luteoviolacea H33 TaxID=1365251 RepID=A0A167E4L6_9GAMM|nr:hypothetical protein [Pseudoalteromonas luteoviolacea]KZN50034.1 hypothetical protein N476_16945 [Pseudoalteromonas luteoviolacea H33]KZN76392.1 hypothetical protein N477_16940 [Pseudoalteromonas luteoviolacea H33-S]MBQ4877785.1 hypothetical protein [Pseudoalteromonas luteoviolacea]MBQ4906769.1 hypothetical protein [Pseudoalteromonas luteoviolacea]